MVTPNLPLYLLFAVEIVIQSMKHIVFTLTFFISAFAFAQNTASLTGVILDLEENNSPLLLAKVLIKETGAQTLSDENGNFKFENLKEGVYTLVSSFVGYKTASVETKVITNKANAVKLGLSANSISLEDLVGAFASSDNKTTSSL